MRANGVESAQQECEVKYRRTRKKKHVASHFDPPIVAMSQRGPIEIGWSRRVEASRM